MLIPKTRKEIYLAYLSGDTDLALPTPVTRDEIILYNACINGAGTNPSWNDLTDKPELAKIAESGSWNDLTDRPFGETLVEVAVAETATYITDKLRGSGEDAFNMTSIGTYRLYEESNPLFATGDKYIVYWNGTRYELTGYQNGADYYLGGSRNMPSLMSKVPEHADDAPFLLRWNMLDYEIVVFTREPGVDLAGEPFEIGIYEEKTVITPVSPIYLPKAAAVADVTDAPTAEDFNSLLASLREAGYMAT